MAYPGFEPGPPRSEVRRANHCAIGAPFEVRLSKSWRAEILHEHALLVQLSLN
jgi:hypothetical protein